jgi:transposase
MRQAARIVHWDRVLADMAYDAEANHQVCRDELGIRSTVIPRNPRQWPDTVRIKGRYRSQMVRRFPCRIYGHRWQVESSFSQDKRVLGSALRSRREKSQNREGLLRVLTHDLMILRLPA